MFCPNCGAEMKESVCDKCGIHLQLIGANISPYSDAVNIQGDPKMVFRHILQDYNIYVNDIFLPVRMKYLDIFNKIKGLENEMRNLCGSITNEQYAYGLSKDKRDLGETDIEPNNDDYYWLFERYYCKIDSNRGYYNMDLYTILDEQFKSLGWTYRWQQMKGMELKDDIAKPVMILLVATAEQKHFSESMAYRSINSYCQALYVCEQRIISQIRVLLLKKSERKHFKCIADVIRRSKEEGIIIDSELKRIDKLWQSKSSLNAIYQGIKNYLDNTDKHIPNLSGPRKSYHRIKASRNDYVHLSYSDVEEKLLELPQRIKESFKFLLLIFDYFYYGYINGEFDST